MGLRTGEARAILLNSDIEELFAGTAFVTQSTCIVSYAVNCEHIGGEHIGSVASRCGSVQPPLELELGGSESSSVTALIGEYQSSIKCWCSRIDLTCAWMRVSYSIYPWPSLQGQRTAPFHQAKNAACRDGTIKPLEEWLAR